MDRLEARQIFASDADCLVTRYHDDGSGVEITSPIMGPGEAVTIPFDAGFGPGDLRRIADNWQAMIDQRGGQRPHPDVCICSKCV